MGTAHVHVSDHLSVVRADPAAELVAVSDRVPRTVEVLGELPAFSRTAAWMRQPEQGGARGFADLGIHLLDALLWLRPEAALTVCGAHLLRTSGPDLDDGGTALLDWAGTPTTVHAGWTGRPGGLYLHLEGTLGVGDRPGRRPDRAYGTCLYRGR